MASIDEERNGDDDDADGGSEVDAGTSDATGDDIDDDDARVRAPANKNDREDGNGVLGKSELTDCTGTRIELSPLYITLAVVALSSN